MEFLLLPILAIVFFVALFLAGMFFSKEKGSDKDKGYIRRKSPDDININIPATNEMLVEFLDKLDEALASSRDYTFSLENETYTIPQEVLSKADWRYRFEEYPQNGGYRLDLKLKAGLQYVNPNPQLTYEEFRMLVQQLAWALKNQDDFRYQLQNQQIQIPASRLSQGSHRFEYEYEKEYSGKTEYELEFHLRSGNYR